MTRAAPRAASVLFATLLFAAACGGGNELSEEEFVDQVNEICTEASEELSELGAEVNPDDPEELAEFAGAFADNVRGQIEDMQELEGPSEIEDELNPVLDETLEILDEVEENPDMILSEEDPFANLATEMEELGLSECV